VNKSSFDYIIAHFGSWRNHISLPEAYTSRVLSTSNFETERSDL